MDDGIGRQPLSPLGRFKTFAATVLEWSFLWIGRRWGTGINGRITQNGAIPTLVHRVGLSVSHGRSDSNAVDVSQRILDTPRVMLSPRGLIT